MKNGRAGAAVQLVGTYLTERGRAGHSAPEGVTIPTHAAQTALDDLLACYRAIHDALGVLLESEESPHTETERFMAREAARAALAQAEGR